MKGLFSLILIFVIGCSTTSSHTSSDIAYAPGAFTQWQKAGRNYEAAQYAEALQAYQEFTQAYPYSRWNEMAYYFIAQCHHKLNQTESARKAYQQVVEKYPGTVWADLARDRMGELGK